MSRPLGEQTQSDCNAVFGSTLAARSAGIQLATIATAINVIATTAKIAGSRGDWWNSSG